MSRTEAELEVGHADATLAMDAWYRQQRSRMIGLCVTFVRDVGVAEDIVNETFARAIANKIAPQQSSVGWLNTVARNLCVDHIRRERHLIALDESLDFGISDVGLESADRADDLALVIRALKSLPERERSVLWLRDGEGFSYEEIAALAALTPRAARNLAFRVRQSVRTQVAVWLSQVPGMTLLIYGKVRRIFRDVGPRGIPALAAATAVATIALTIPGLATRGREHWAIPPVNLEDAITLARGPILAEASETDAVLSPERSAGKGSPPAKPEIEHRYRRPDAAVPEHASVRVTVTSPSGEPLFAAAFGVDCENDGSGLGEQGNPVFVGC